jgi:hypothetical protein
MKMSNSHYLLEAKLVPGEDNERRKNFRCTAWAAAAMAMLITGCSRTVKWDEEVLLNIGQTIMVKRTEMYSVQGDAGNPLDLAYRPHGNTKNEFVWAGKYYIFDGHGGAMVLAISPQGVPVFVAPADSGSWDAVHDYKCTLPFYVEFIPDATGRGWTWPDSIEPWLYNLPANLFGERKPPSEMKARYTPADVAKQGFMSDPRIAYLQRVDPSHTGDICKSKLRGK